MEGMVNMVIGWKSREMRDNQRIMRGGWVKNDFLMFSLLMIWGRKLIKG